MVSDEARIVANRMNLELASQISLIRMAVSTIPNQSVKPQSTSKAAKEFTAKLKEMVDGS